MKNLNMKNLVLGSILVSLLTGANASMAMVDSKTAGRDELVAQVENKVQQLAALNQQVSTLRQNISEYESSRKTGKTIRNVGVVVSGIGLVGIALGISRFADKRFSEYGDITGGSVSMFFGAIIAGGGIIQTIGGQLYVVIEDRNLRSLDESLKLKQIEISTSQNELNLIRESLN